MPRCLGSYAVRIELFNLMALLLLLLLELYMYINKLGYEHSD